jgi:hypothetical protein
MRSYKESEVLLHELHEVGEFVPVWGISPLADARFALFH